MSIIVVMYGAVGKRKPCRSGGPGLIPDPGQTYDQCRKVGSFL
jgi:hypothetical protein